MRPDACRKSAGGGNKRCGPKGRDAREAGRETQENESRERAECSAQHGTEAGSGCRTKLERAGDRERSNDETKHARDGRLPGRDENALAERDARRTMMRARRAGRSCGFSAAAENTRRRRSWNRSRFRQQIPDGWNTIHGPAEQERRQQKTAALSCSRRVVVDRGFEPLCRA